jgi:hypothetical protein
LSFDVNAFEFFVSPFLSLPLSLFVVSHPLSHLNPNPIPLPLNPNPNKLSLAKNLTVTSFQDKFVDTTVQTTISACMSRQDIICPTLLPNRDRNTNPNPLQGIRFSGVLYKRSLHINQWEERWCTVPKISDKTKRQDEKEEQIRRPGKDQDQKTRRKRRTNTKTRQRQDKRQKTRQKKRRKSVRDKRKQDKS